MCVWEIIRGEIGGREERGGGKTYGDVEDKVMLEGLRALRRWRRVLSWGEGSMVVVGPWFFLYIYFSGGGKVEF